MKDLYKNSIVMLVQSIVTEVSTMLHPDKAHHETKVEFIEDAFNNIVDVNVHMIFVEGEEFIHRNVKLSEVVGLDVKDLLHKSEVLYAAMNITK